MRTPDQSTTEAIGRLQRSRDFRAFLAWLEAERHNLREQNEQPAGAKEHTAGQCYALTQNFAEVETATRSLNVPEAGQGSSDPGSG